MKQLLVLLAISSLWSPAPAAAAQLTATPDNLASVLARSKGGDTVVITGDVSQRRIKNLSFSPPITLDARSATFTALELFDVKGLTLVGGTYRPWCGPTVKGPMCGYALTFNGAENVAVRDARFVGPEESRPGLMGVMADGHGLTFGKSSKVELTGSSFVGFKGGLVIGTTDGFIVRDNAFYRLRAAGMQVGESRSGVIEDNLVYGIRVVSDEHPDGFQFWSRPTSPPVSDIVIRRNTVVGDTQGIAFQNHIRAGIDDGGFDRITIEDNDIWVSAPGGIVVNAIRGLTLNNNRVRTIAGSPYRSSIDPSRSSDIARAGNTVAAAAGKPSASDPTAGSPPGNTDGRQLEDALAARTSVKIESLKTKGRLIVDFMTPAQGAAALAAVLAVPPLK